MSSENVQYFAVTGGSTNPAWLFLFIPFFLIVVGLVVRSIVKGKR